MMENSHLKCCFTGYRPQKMPFKFDRNDREYRKFEDSLLDEVINLTNENCTEFLCGMAMGFDIVAAETVLLVKKAKPEKDIRLVAVQPFPEQSNTFSKSWKDRYDNIISNCDNVITVCDEYSRDCYFKRNKYMVDKSDFVLTWFDGKPGGTANTVKYAEKLQRGIINLKKDGEIKGINLKILL